MATPATNWLRRSYAEVTEWLQNVHRIKLGDQRRLMNAVSELRVWERLSQVHPYRLTKKEAGALSARPLRQ